MMDEVLNYHVRDAHGVLNANRIENYVEIIEITKVF